MSLYGVQRDLQREMNRIFDSVFPTPRKATEEGFESAVWRPVVDVHEDQNSYYIDAELPGLTREDVKINYQDGTLSVSGERNYRYEKKSDEANGANGNGNGSGDRNAHRLERFYGKFFRSFSFETAVNADAITAKFENGVLTIAVPKAEAIRPRQIEIR
jgi:HSP20 family protein